ncbi:MAG: hypothetical protein A2Z83_04795 [Omnitrophica bacterium GWA2_52_8]|nr:MAG: hypothetical protein A2Z83_04795 [Omnitrophica bacterium GWA2_52_8]
MKFLLRAPNKIVIASPLVLLAGAAISGFEIASSASPPRNDKAKGGFVRCSNSELIAARRPRDGESVTD